MKSRSLSPRLVAGAFLLLGTGCASLPEPQAAPTGEPLSVEEKTRSYRYVVKQKVGTIKHTNSRGYTGTSNIYVDRTKVGHYTVWSAYQGDAKISDDDLYAIARDEAAAREVRSSREDGVLMNRIGIGLSIVGILAAGTGILLNSQRAEDSSPNLPVGLLIGGATGFSIGSYLTYSGATKAKEEHPLGQERAEQAADRYNATLPGGAQTRN